MEKETRLNIPDFIKSKIETSPNDKLWKRYGEMIADTDISLEPKFPNSMLIEVANICNHACSFCAYTKMDRAQKYIEPELFKRIVKEGFELGAREVGLHGGAEPLTCKYLPEFIKYCSEVGYNYIYFTTNGTLGTPKKWDALLSSGVNSIKFSVNGGDRDTYSKIHGKDHFERAIKSINYVSRKRKEMNLNVYLSVSFVEVEENKHSFTELKSAVEPLVDEIFHSVATNQAGQMPELPVSPTIPEICNIPFGQVNITREGHLRGCCNDYQNMLVVEDIGKVGLKEAWYGNHMKLLRKMHLEGNYGNSLCNNCVNNCQEKVEALRPDLAPWNAIY